MRTSFGTFADGGLASLHIVRFRKMLEGVYLTESKKRDVLWFAAHSLLGIVLHLTQHNVRRLTAESCESKLCPGILHPVVTLSV